MGCADKSGRSIIGCSQQIELEKRRDTLFKFTKELEDQVYAMRESANFHSKQPAKWNSMDNDPRFWEMPIPSAAAIKLHICIVCMHCVAPLSICRDNMNTVTLAVALVRE